MRAWRAVSCGRPIGNRPEAPAKPGYPRDFHLRHLSGLWFSQHHGRQDLRAVRPSATRRVAVRLSARAAARVDAVRSDHHKLRAGLFKQVERVEQVTVAHSMTGYCPPSSALADGDVRPAGQQDRSRFVRCAFFGLEQQARQGGAEQGNMPDRREGTVGVVAGAAEDSSTLPPPARGARTREEAAGSGFPTRPGAESDKSVEFRRACRRWAACSSAVQAGGPARPRRRPPGRVRQA
jgi:hypothetical protein